MAEEKDTQETHMVKIPKQEYQMLLEAREKLMEQGYQRLPPAVIQKANLENFTRGTVTGLGIAALLYLLTRNEK